MIVLDASAVIALLLREPSAAGLVDRVLGGEPLHAPHLLDVEAAHACRRLAARGQITAERGRLMLALLADMPTRRYAHDMLLPRIWTLRATVTAYDATYVALSEVLGARLLTRDRRLANAAGHLVSVEVV